MRLRTMSCSNVHSFYWEEANRVLLAVSEWIIASPTWLEDRPNTLRRLLGRSVQDPSYALMVEKGGKVFPNHVCVTL